MTDDAKTSDRQKAARRRCISSSSRKLIKGVLALALAFGILKLADKDLPDLFNQLVRWVHLDPENRFFSEISDRLDANHAGQRALGRARHVSLQPVFAGRRHRADVPRAVGRLAGDRRIGLFHSRLKLRELVRHPHWYVSGRAGVSTC